MNPTSVRPAGSRWLSALWQWATVAVVVTAIVCVVGWPRLTLCAVGALLAVVTLVAGIRRFAGERRTPDDDLTADETRAGELADMARTRDEWQWRTQDTQRQTRCQRERAEQAEAALDRVREIHQRAPVKPWPQGNSFSPVSHCTCGGRWPCPTVRTLELTNATTEEATS